MSTTGTLPPGFALHRGWAADTILSTVRDAVRWEQRAVHMFGRDVREPRLTSWMGSAAYTYSGIRHEPSDMPRCVATLRARASELVGVWFNSALGNLYRDGRDSIGWHSDDEPELGPEPAIASLSLGAPRLFKIRAVHVGGRLGKREAHTILLDHGDLLVMSGRSQADYQHSVPKVPMGVDVGAAPRVNLTFRRIVDARSRPR